MDDNIIELIESDFPNEFDLVVKVSNNAYQAANTKHLVGGWAVKMFDNLIWIMHPPLNNSTELELKINHVLSCLYTDYFERLQQPLKMLLEEHDFDFSFKYRLNLYPSSLSSATDLSFLAPYFSSLSKENPLMVVTHKIENLKVRSCIVYDATLVMNLFSSSSNSCEKFCIKQLLQSLIYFSGDVCSDEAEKKAIEFVENNIPDGPKGYAIETINVCNPRLNEYVNYQEASQTELIRVNSEIAAFIDDSNILPREYEEEDAKKLSKFIFDFLYQRLEDEIKRYDESLLFYAYKQVELIEGKRELNRWQVGIDASKRTDYDYIGKNVDEIIEIASHVSSAKLIIELFVKIYPDGSNQCTNDSWSYLQALSIMLHEIIVIYEDIKYDIIPHKLIVHENYSITDERGEELFDHEGFYRRKSELTSHISSQKIEKKQHLM